MGRRLECHSPLDVRCELSVEEGRGETRDHSSANPIPTVIALPLREFPCARCADSEEMPLLSGSSDRATVELAARPEVTADPADSGTEALERSDKTLERACGPLHRSRNRSAERCQRAAVEEVVQPEQDVHNRLHGR